jgi:hypothetical protein
VIDEIRELMIRSAESCQRREVEQRETASSSKATVATQQSSGADEQLQRTVWDPGGFQQRWGAHEKELMNFSQQRSMMQEHRSQASHAPTNQPTQRIQ